MKHGWFAATCALAALFAGRLIALDWWRYDIFRVGVDGGIFAQIASSLFTGFHSTVEGDFNHLLVHSSPLLAVATPFVWLWGGKGLLALQVLAIAAIALPLYGIARARTSSPLGFALVAIALLYPVLWAEAFGDFHENAFAPALSAALVWALVVRRWRLGLLFALLLTGVKEDQFVILAGVGLTIALWARNDREQRRFGIGVLAIGVCAALVYFGVIRNVIHPSVRYWSLHFYDWSYAGPSPQGKVELTSPERLYYLIAAFAPLAFVPFGSRYVLLALTGFVEVLASHERITMSITGDYTTAWSGYVLAAFVASGANLFARRSQYGWIACAAATVCSLWYQQNRNPMALWYYLYRAPSAHDALLEQQLRAIPAGVTIGAEDQVFAHLGTNPLASIDLRGQDYFVYDGTQFSEQWRDVDGPLAASLVKKGDYRKLFERDGIVVLRKVR